MQKEFGGYLGRCIFECDHIFRQRYPTEGVDYTRLQVLFVLQEKRDATTGEHIKDKCRCTMMGNLLLAAGLYPDPSTNYCPTMGSDGLHYIMANAAYKRWGFSSSDSISAFQHTTSTRSKPDVVFLRKELTGADKDQDYFINTLFQGLPEASRGWYDYTMSFLLFPPCNLTPSESNPCVLNWRGPPTKDPTEQGEEKKLPLTTISRPGLKMPQHANNY